LGVQVALRNTVFPYTTAQIQPPAIPSIASTQFIFTYNPHLQLPYTLEWNLALEQALGKDQTVSLSYVGASGRRLLQTSYFSSPPSNPGVLIGQFVDNTAESNYNALQAQFRRRLSRGLQVLASYTWSHSIDDASAGSVANSSNGGVPGGADENRGNSDFDIRHTFTAGITYDLPVPRSYAWVRALAGGWSVDSFILARSAAPVDVEDENFFLLNEVVASVRPDIVPGQSFYLRSSQYPGGMALNPLAFTDPPADPVTGNPLRQGTLSRNRLRGFGASQLDFAVHREFVIREPWKIQFRAEMFNVLNHPNFGQPSVGFGAGGFGVATQTLGQYLSGGAVGGGALNPLYQIGGPRSIQLALKLLF